MCLKYQVYKVYTIGDGYVVMEFTDKDKRNPGKEAKNVVQMALAMIDIIIVTKKEINFEKLNMRIGIHTVSYQIILSLNLFLWFIRAHLLEVFSVLILSAMIFMDQKC